MGGRECCHTCWVPPGGCHWDHWRSGDTATRLPVSVTSQCHLYANTQREGRSGFQLPLSLETSAGSLGGRRWHLRPPFLERSAPQGTSLARNVLGSLLGQPPLHWPGFSTSPAQEVRKPGHHAGPECGSGDRQRSRGQPLHETEVGERRDRLGDPGPGPPCHAPAPAPLYLFITLLSLHNFLFPRCVFPLPRPWTWPIRSVPGDRTKGPLSARGLVISCPQGPSGPGMSEMLSRASLLRRGLPGQPRTCPCPSSPPAPGMPGALRASRALGLVPQFPGPRCAV